MQAENMCSTRHKVSKLEKRKDRRKSPCHLDAPYNSQLLLWGVKVSIYIIMDMFSKLFLLVLSIPQTLMKTICILLAVIISIALGSPVSSNHAWQGKRNEKHRLATSIEGEYVQDLPIGAPKDED